MLLDQRTAAAFIGIGIWLTSLNGLAGNPRVTRGRDPALGSIAALVANPSPEPATDHSCEQPGPLHVVTAMQVPSPEGSPRKPEGYQGCDAHCGDQGCSEIACGASSCGSIRDGCRGAWGSWHRRDHEHCSCRMPQHYPYYPSMHGNYYFRPYHPAHVTRQRELASQWGEDSRNPYAGNLFQRVYAQVRGEAVPLPPAPLNSP